METNLTVEQKPEKKRFKKGWAITGLAAVIVLAGLGTGYAKMDLFKSPKMVYLEAEAKSVADLSADLSEAYAKYEKEVLPYLENPVHSTMELSNITVDANIPDPQAQQFLTILKDVKLTADTTMNDKAHQQYSKVSLLLKEKNFIGFEMFMDESKIGFGVPDFYKKYGYIDLKDRDTLKEKYKIEGLPKRFVTSGDFINAVKISKEEINLVLTQYAILFAESISDQQVTLKNDVAFEQEGYKTSGREVTVTFTDEQLQSLFTKIADKAAADEKLFDLFYTRYSNVAKLMIDSGYPDVEQLSKEELKSEFKKGVEDFKKELQSDTAKGGLQMVLLIDGSDNILSRKIMPLDENGKQDGGLLTLSKWSNNGENNYLVTLNDTEEDGGKGEVKLSYKAKQQGTENKGNFGLLVKSEGSPAGDYLVDFNTQFTVKAEGNKETGNYNFNMKADNASTGEEYAFSGNLSSSLVKNDNKQDSDLTFKLNFDQLEDPTLPKSLGFQVKSTNEIIKEVKLPALTAENSLNLATMTEEQMMEVQQEVEAAAQQFMINNMQLLQELGIIPPM